MKIYLEIKVQQNQYKPSIFTTYHNRYITITSEEKLLIEKNHITTHKTDIAVLLAAIVSIKMNYSLSKSNRSSYSNYIRNRSNSNN